MCAPDCQLAALEIPHRHPKPGPSMTEIYAMIAAAYPGRGPRWVCHHVAGRIPEITDGRATHMITERQRQAIAEFHRTHPKVKRARPNSLP